MKGFSISRSKSYLFILNTHQFSEREFIEFLSTEEVEKSKSIQDDKDRKNFVLRKGILRQLLSEILDINAKEIIFNQSVNGKPELKNNSGLHFNTSHTLDFMLIGIDFENAVGVDLESMDRHIEIDKLIHFALSENEQKKMIALEEEHKKKFFLKHWTLKEAILKAQGIGISEHMNLLEVMIINDENAEIEKWPGMNCSEWTIKNVVIGEVLLGAIAVKSKDRKIEFREIDAEFNYKLV